MHMYAIFVIKNSEEVKCEYSDYVNSLWYLQKKSAKEYMLFFSKLSLEKLDHGRHTLKSDEYNFHLYKSEVSIVLVCDAEYPLTTAHTFMNSVLVSYKDEKLIDGVLRQMLTDAQSPEKVDKLYKIKKDLDQTIKIVQNSIESVLARRVKLDKLVQDSNDLSDMSKLFYQNSAKHNKCCIIS